MNNTQKMAIEKLEKERDFKGGSNYAQAVGPEVAKALITFCEQSETFAMAVVAGDTLKDCCEKITQGVRQSISDLEVYTRAVRHYMPGADIEWNMTIRPAGGEETTTPAFNVSFLELIK